MISAGTKWRCGGEAEIGGWGGGVLSPYFKWVLYALVLSVKKGSLDRLFAPNYILGLPVSDS